MKQILWIILGLSVFLNAGFTTAGQPNGVVKDTSTQLQWQDDYSANGNSIMIATWEDAIDYCATLGLAGLDWRLPNKNELLSLVDYKKYNPSIDTVFNHTTSYYYWSSTTSAYDTYYAWVVFFTDGRTYDYYKFSTRAVRCVR